MKTKLQKMLLASLIGVLPMTNVLAEDNSNGFQIAPPPIAHPIFAEGIKDQKFDFNFISMSSDEVDVDLEGFGASYIVREAYSDSFAVSAQMGLFMLTGTMPGLALPVGSFIPDPATFSDADVSMMSMPFSANIEMQLIKADAASLIVFIGPNLGFSVMNMKTSYKTISPTSPTYTNLAQVTSTTAGLQFGMQAGLRMSDAVKISPFFMVSSSSGSANFNYKAGAQGVADTSYTGGEIPDVTTSSIGMDIIIKELSIGTVLQDLQRSSSDGSDAGGMQTAMIRFGYKF